MPQTRGLPNLHSDYYCDHIVHRLIRFSLETNDCLANQYRLAIVDGQLDSPRAHKPNPSIASWAFGGRI